MNHKINSFFDSDTYTFSYIVSDDRTGVSVVIDPVLTYDSKTGRTSTATADKVVSFIRDNGLRNEWILETHAHADHLTAAQYIKSAIGGRIAIGQKVTEVQKVFKDIFNLNDEFLPDGSQFDYLISDQEIIEAGDIKIKAIFVPGHTPACLAYQIKDSIFVGDTLFMPDVGTARCDFPGGDAKKLYKSIQKLLSYPPQTKLFMCHDYPPNDRKVKCQTTVVEQMEKNIHCHALISENEFVQMRNERDKTLEMPVLLIPAIQVNIRAGALPTPESNGTSYLKIPINLI